MAPDPVLLLGWLLPAWLLGGMLVLPLESLIEPRQPRSARPAAAWAIQLGLWTLAFLALLLLSGRPVFSATLALAGCLLVVLVNNAKVRALREPFLFSDFGLFSQALRHPRLYLPFLGVQKALLGAIAIVASVSLGLALEPPLPRLLGWSVFLAVTLAGLVAAGALLWWGGRSMPPPSLDPVRDLDRFGLPASLWSYWRLERCSDTAASNAERIAMTSPLAVHEREAPAELPHIVAVQSESFFDPRRLSGAVRPAVLARFDRIREQALLHGRLTVPAWGANTMRTEFGFLTGLAADRLGVHRFNPYRRFARRSLPSLASTLQKLGYRTLCIHPHPASFFGRDRVFPRLGFDEFIDARHFNADETCGPYICDAAVTRKVSELLKRADRPLFVFVITMENHGPLHLEAVSPGDIERYYDSPPPSGSDDLTVYLRHLENADRMLDDLTGILSDDPRDGLLCWFGDHVPSLPQVYAAADFDDGRTEYLIWRSGASGPQRQDLSIEHLAPALLDAAGLSIRT